MCEMIFTSDQKFFDKIDYEESKRYFKESYKFICEYKNLGEQNIISAVVHMDEDTPHMHLLFIPVVHTIDKQANKIDKVCCRDFWRGKNSYRDLQNTYFKHISEKGFKLERGALVEVTNREHYSVQEYKRVTNFEDTKELSKQTTIIDKAEKFEKEQENLLNYNTELKVKCRNLELDFSNKEKELKYKYEHETYKIDYQYQKIINKLENENNYLKKVIERFKVTAQKFISWICHKFSAPSEDSLIRDFEKETYKNFNIEK